MLAILLLTLAAPERVAVDLATARSETLQISHPAPGTVRLTLATAGGSQAVVGEPFGVANGVLAAGAEVRCGALWNRDAGLGLEFLDGAGKAVGKVLSRPLYRTMDWQPVLVDATVPGNAKSARLLLTLYGDARADLDQASWAEFRKLRHWVAPEVALTLPGHGYVKPGEPWQAMLKVGPPAGSYVVEMVGADGEPCATWEGRQGEHMLTREALAPGYYELRWSARDGQLEVLREGRVSFACLPDFDAPASSPFAVDAGFSWGIIQRGPERAKRIADLLYRIGLRRTRDRLSVSGTMKERGKLELGSYADAARLQREAGLSVYTIMHDIPRWMATAPDEPRPWTQPPADLRDLYAYFAAAAKEMAGSIDAWELWNEPDISFFAGRAEEYAGIVKAGYLGVKAGHPDANVLLGSPAHALGPWVNLAFESGLADYYDTFNFHTYRDPASIPGDTQVFRELQQRYGVDRPIWLTETGSTAEPVQGETLPAERAQAADYVKRYALAASQRIEHVFAFYLQEWRQPGAPPYGLLRPDDTPRPALVALATLTRMLGAGRPLGRQTDLPGITALWFETGRGPAAVVWANQPVARPESLTGTRWVGLFGADAAPPAQLGPEPIFVLAAPPAGLQPPPPAPSPRTANAAERSALQVVLDLRLKPAEDAAWDTDARKQPVKVVPGQPLPAEAVVYNFGSRPAQVRVASELPAGWRLDGLRAEVAVAPGERVVQPLTIRVGALPDETPYRVRLTAAASGYRVAPAVAACAPATSQLQVEVRRRLGDATPLAERWTASHNEAMEVALTPRDNGVAYHATMSAAAGNRWGFAQMAASPAERLAEGEGLRFKLTVPQPWHEGLIVILHEADGSQYHGHGGMMDAAGEREVRLLWTDFRLNAGVSQDENAQLDLEQVNHISFGTSARGPQTAGSFEIAAIELFRLRREP